MKTHMHCSLFCKQIDRRGCVKCRWKNRFCPFDPKRHTHFGGPSVIVTPQTRQAVEKMLMYILLLAVGPKPHFFKKKTRRTPKSLTDGHLVVLTFEASMRPAGNFTKSVVTSCIWHRHAAISQCPVDHVTFSRNTCIKR